MPNDVSPIDRQIDEALALHRQGKLDEAEAIYHDVLAQHPNHAEILHFLGLIAHQKGEHERAISLLKQAIDVLPQTAQFQSNLGLVQTCAELFHDAAVTFKNLLATHSNDPNIANAYATALKGTKNWDEAKSVLCELIGSYPNYAPGHFNLGNLYLAQGYASLAVPLFETAFGLAPNDATGRNLATALQNTGHNQRAISLLLELVEKSPSDSAALNNLSNLHREAGKLDEAQVLLDRALLIDPTLADAWYNLGSIQVTQNDCATGVLSFKRALDSRPCFIKADWAAKLALPQIYESENQRQDMRAHWQAGLMQIRDAPIQTTPEGIQAALAAISEITPFALAYQGADDRLLMSEWGQQVSTITQTAYFEFSELAPIPNRDRKRIVFVSAHFRSHTIERLFSGWVTGLEPAEFDVHFVSTSGAGDRRTTDMCAAVSGSFTASTSIIEIASHIHKLAADIIIYPDIGMDPRTQVLAALRLAPRQAMSWGHPVTSGLPTIDTFLSSALMEPNGSQAHYTENLVCLPHLSIDYARPSMPKDKISHDFQCAQSLFKIPPHQDHVFAKIIKQIPGRTLSFFAHPITQVTAAFQTRIARAFKSAGLDPDETLRFIAPCDRQKFLSHLAGSRVILDTFEWSGGNTSLESFAMGKPVVTLPGKFMRGQHTSAMIRLMGIDELNVGTEDAYIAEAIKLISDEEYYKNVIVRIEQRSSCLFNDQEAIMGLASFLREH
ncbi:tetratricopeptide repeat protein [Rhodospirillales bacterium]|nr:tetratricopeptide repeat protein [Rhodospirillales bacterium]